MIDNDEENETSESEEDEKKIPRRSNRKRNMPLKYKDYIVYLTKNSTPETYNDAITCEENEQWKNAMHEEILSMEMHNVWQPVNRPKNKKIIKSRWIYKIKENGYDRRYKARLVAVGCNQKRGIDYEENFSPVMKWDSLRILLALASKNAIIKLYDVKTAYLNGNLDEEIFMEPPTGYDLPDNKVYKIKRSIYGLPQSGRCWYEKFSQILKQAGMTRLKSDPSVFTKKEGENYIHIGIYVDDFIIVASSENIIKDVIKKIKQCIDIKETTDSNMFLGLEIKQSENEIILSQKNYIMKILEKFDMKNCNPMKTPGTASDKELEKYEKSKKFPQNKYQEAIGSIMYLAIGTRPDIAYTISKLSQYNRDPREIHWTAVKRLLRYLKGTIDLSLKFEKITGKLRGTSDASWSTTPDAKSYGGYMQRIGNALIGWKSGKQKLVALSTMEAELLAACECVCALRWSSDLLEELGEYDLAKKPIVIETDSKALIDWVSNHKVSGRTRHINRKFHFVKDDKDKGEIVFLHRGTDELEADVLTKHLPSEIMHKHMTSVGLIH